VEHISSDLKFVLRSLSRSPLFVLVAVMSLALGIGANSAIFSLLDQVLLRSLPVQDPSTLTAATLLLATVALAAGYIPALRATRIDPVDALRWE